MNLSASISIFALGANINKTGELFVSAELITPVKIKFHRNY